MSLKDHLSPPYRNMADQLGLTNDQMAVMLQQNIHEQYQQQDVQRRSQAADNPQKPDVGDTSDTASDE